MRPLRIFAQPTRVATMDKKRIAWGPIVSNEALVSSQCARSSALPASRFIASALLLIGLVLTSAGCGDEAEIKCGRGTALEDGECVAEANTPIFCGEGTELIGDRCELRCGDEESPIDGVCAPIAIPTPHPLVEGPGASGLLIASARRPI